LRRVISVRPQSERLSTSNQRNGMLYVSSWGVSPMAFQITDDTAH
jgi:hypothetical protein